jgi:G:T/U-mismatch repair DNA glycosylase
MNKTLHISDDLKLPLEMAAEAACIVGVRGSGKTNTARAMAEELFEAGIPICVIDPTDAWWGLRSTRDGRGEGYPVFIFGGEHGDLPLEETHGKTIAEFLVSERVPVVLSLRHLRKNAQRRFVTDLAEELYHLKGKPENRQPLTVFIDEAPLFIPQRVLGEMARTVGAVEDLIARGRNAGFGVVLIGQRFATMNKDVTTQAGTIICHRTTSPQDRKAIAEWIEENATIEQQRETLATLATLDDGQAWIWATRINVYQCVQMRLSTTFDSGATPKMGQRVIQPKKLAEIDKDKLKARMSAAIEQKKANDPAELKKMVAQLQRELQTVKVAKPEPVKVQAKRVEVPVIRDVQIKRVETLHQRADERAKAVWEKFSASINPLMDILNKSQAEIGQLLAAARAVQNVPSSQPMAGRVLASPHGRMPVGVEANRIARPPAATTNPTPRRHTETPPADNGEFIPNSSQRRILDALAWFESIGVQAADRNAVGLVAKIKPTGGHFGNTIGPLSTNDLITYPTEGTVSLTEHGRAMASVPDSPPTLEEYHRNIRMILAKKNGTSARMFDVIVDYGGDITVQQIGELARVDPEGGHFGNCIGPLGTLGLITRRDGIVRPTELLFPPALVD